MKEQNLSFCFEYDKNDDNCPNSVQVKPHPRTITDNELMLTASTCIQALASRYGLERAIEMVNDAACGKLCDGIKFDTRWLRYIENKT